MKVDRLVANVYRFPTATPEADGTLEWDATTAVTVTAHAGNLIGLGWTYSTGAAAHLVTDVLGPALSGCPVDNVGLAFEEMRRTCRNLGTRGLAMQAISAVDIALWDLKARAHGMALADLFGKVREDAQIYGSGGFVSMTDDEMLLQLRAWKDIGCTAAKIKIGQRRGSMTARDLERTQLAQDALGAEVAVMVDANGAYGRGQARRVGGVLDEIGVIWFEEPVTSDDLDGLAELRTALRCDVAAGEYSAELADSAQLVQAVDCVQLDATRCGGYTGFLRAAALADSSQRDVSAHCAPAIHAPVAVAVPNLRHIEYFADHARLEPVLLHGTPTVCDGRIRPNATIGHGYALRSDLRQWLVDRRR
jgi:L-alanine-DL-glutamate epimerase-like enolase superfamily enzyme